MAVCDVCNREMTTAASCDAAAQQEKLPLESAGVPYQPIPYGADAGMNPPDFVAACPRCPDCGVSVGGLHHPGCDREQCPKCRGQLIGCGCFSDEEPDDA